MLVRSLAVSLLIGLSLVSCGPESTAPPGQATLASPIEAAPSSTFEEPVLGPRRSKAATNLQAAPECDTGNTPVVHLSWTPARDRGTAQKVAVTAFANGFETGQFEVSPRLSPRATKYDWTEVTANGSYQWRVLTRHGSWIGSKISSFIGPSCGVEDYG
jgi:hypothetical protein